MTGPSPRTDDHGHGYVTISAFTDRPWHRLAGAVGAPYWRDDPRLASAAGRVAHTDEPEPLIEAVTVTKTTAERITVLDEAGTAAGPVLRYGETLRDEQLSAREMIVEMEHPLTGRVRALGQPAKFSQSRTGAYDRPAPWPGQHTEQVLRGEPGVSEAELKELIERGPAYNKHPEAAQ